MKGTTFWDVTVPRVMSTYANAVFLVLWVGFIIALVVNQAWLDMVWDWAQALPLVPRIIVWVLFLPILVGLWVWESSWSGLARGIGFAAIVGWTMLAASSLFKAIK